MKQQGTGVDRDVIIQVSGVSKTYADGFQALKPVDLHIQRGEIFALLGPNGAGKTTLISIICGIVNASAGRISVDGHDIKDDYRSARQRIGLVPQELTTEAFETVWNTVSFSRGLFGKPRNPDYIEKVLKDLALWDKKDSIIMSLSGGMKRRVLIAKALSHEPTVLFLDEPTAGVDVALRRGMWDVVQELQNSGVTIILTTHYIAEAEELADRVGVINQGNLVLVEDKHTLMQRFGRKQVVFDLIEPVEALPATMAEFNLAVSHDGTALSFTFEPSGERTGLTRLLTAMRDEAIHFHDLRTEQSTLEDIFIDLVAGEESDVKRREPA